MSSEEPTTPLLSVNDIAAMSDAALAEFMEKNRRPNGAFELPIADWDKLSMIDRKALAKRLMAQEGALTRSSATYSRPLDLSLLDTRLRKVCADADNASALAPPRIIERRSRSPTPYIDLDAVSRERETDAYNNLIKDGGRPLYPIHLLDEVFRHPEEHEELLRPWRDHFGGTKRFWSDNDTAGAPWEVFQRQWSRWRYFYKWQRDNRWLEDDDGGFPAYVEYYKQNIKRYYSERPGAEILAKIEADPSCLKDGWDSRQRDRQRQRHYCLEFHRGDEFPDYINAVNRRLAQHGFTRPFQLKEDPKLQDRLATWIEYLNFEYWWLDRYTDTIERLKPDYDKAWQKLVDSKVLRPHETKESVRSLSSLNQQENEQQRATKARERARVKAEQVYISTQLDPSRLNIPQPERIRRINEARHELLRAQENLDSINRRNDRIGDFVSGTRDLKLAKRDAARHRTLIPWILEQVPLIEAELNQTKAIESESNGIKRTKRRLESDDNISQQRAPKKQRLGYIKKQTHELVSFPAIEEASPAQQEKLRRQQARAIPTKHPPQTLTAQDLRRSARIAAAATDRRNSSADSNYPKSSRSGSTGRSTVQSTKLRAAKKKRPARSSGRRHFIQT